MIDHINVPVSELDKSANFYERALESLGLQPIFRDEEVVGFGGDTWVFGIELAAVGVASNHVAFAVDSCEEVQAFFDAAIAAGGIDNGGPGFRAEYGAAYYAAYVLDPDGHNIEAVCRNGIAG